MYQKIFIGTDEKTKENFAEILIETRNDDYIQCKNNILIFHEKMN
jgi:hypothetical protein